MSPEQLTRGDECDEQEPLPRHLLAFTSAALDHDEGIARHAGDLVWSVHTGIVRHLCELEAMDRALGLSEPTSTTAHRARMEIQRAIAGICQAITGTDNARCALIFR